MPTADFRARLDLHYPLVQAPMAGVATPALAIAVSESGGLGSLGIGASTVGNAATMIADTRAGTAKPFNVNLFCHRPALRDAAREAAWIAHLTPFFAEFDAAPPAALNEIYTDFGSDEPMLRMLLELRPPVVSFHFGLPSGDRLAALRAAGIFTMATATNPREADQIADVGIDAIVAQGIEAGGHRGVFDPSAPDTALTTAVLVRQLSRALNLPILAAGGIMDAAGIRAAIALGAAGVQLGTAFLLCPESAANAAYRAALRSERAHDTRLTTAISGRPARGIVNRLVAAGEAPAAPPVPDYPLAYDAGKALHAAAARAGSHDFAAHWAGQGAPLAEALPAREIVAKLAAAFA